MWQLAGDRIIASAHIQCRNLHDYMQIAEEIKTFFHNKGIHSTTIQPEFVDIVKFDESKLEQQDCMLDCPTKTTCVAQTCCGPQKKKENGKDSTKQAESALNEKPLDSSVIDAIEKPGDNVAAE